jgi:beta-galactosidase
VKIPALFVLGFALASAAVAQIATPAPAADDVLPSPATLRAEYAAQPRPDGKPHTFVARGGQFLLDGKPFHVISGEMHYPRIPREYWRARLRMARAMGLNAITTYVFWNVHEPTPGAYTFSGNADVAEFIREAQQEGLWVILRPGPYVCAEWELGGYPAWLLKDPTTVLRSSDPKFFEPATRWLKRLGQEVAPLQTGNGGPIILVQVENEYGSFGDDREYMERNKQVLLDAGFTKAQLYTADPPHVMANGSLPELPLGINFDGNKPGEAEKSFAALAKFRPDTPRFNSEFWAGWFDHWGGAHAHTSAEIQTANLTWILSHGYSISIYMFHGGTDFGWMNGANSDDKRPNEYHPDVTSYDYDAALDESGRPTPKYFAFRDAIAKITGITPPPAPEVAAPIAIPPIKFTEAASLWDNLPKPIERDHPMTMEDIGQNYGWILYRTRCVTGQCDLGSMVIHDFGQVYVDGKLTPGFPAAHALDRRQGESKFGQTMGAFDRAARPRIDLLVENTGRINFSHQLRTERKGIVGYKAPEGRDPALRWSTYALPMSDVSAIRFKQGSLCSGPCFYRATFNVAAPADTFLDTSQFTKGQLWINGRAMGRFWNIGPQKTLYVPGPWLRKGPNEIVVFDVNGAPDHTVEGLTKPNFGPTGPSGPQ